MTKVHIIFFIIIQHISVAAFFVSSVVCEAKDSTFSWRADMCHWIFVYTASAHGAILPKVLVLHPVLLFCTEAVKVVVLSVSLLGGV